MLVTRGWREGLGEGGMGKYWLTVLLQSDKTKYSDVHCHSKVTRDKIMYNILEKSYKRRF
jgi:hypothetical protein